MPIKFCITNIDSNIKLERIITRFNRIQTSFELILKDNDFKDTTGILNREKFFDHYKSREELIIGITEKPLDNNFFSYIDSDYKTAVISIHQSEIYSPPFKIEDYLLSEILLSILLMLAKMNIGHYETRGCLLDFCENKKDIVIKLHSGSICADCKARLMYYGVTEEMLASAMKVLWDISKDFLSPRVVRGCPIGHKVCKEYHTIQREYSDRNVFLAVSFSDEFKDMIDHLNEKLKKAGFYLKVVNQTIENKNILCKICKTIQTCKFGIAEFSGFKHNVSYEFGLMQAFGLETIAIIKKEKLQEFEKNISDMKGIEVIPYERVGDDLFENLKRFLS